MLFSRQSRNRSSRPEPPAGPRSARLRPRYIPKTPPCMGNCPSGADIRGWLTTIAQAEAYGRTPEQAYQIAWEKITDRNPFPAVCGRVCPHPCEDGCNRKGKDGAVAINALERFVGDFGIGKQLKLAEAHRRALPGESGRRRRRSGGPLLRLPACPAGLSGDGVRGLQPAGRDVALRHPPLSFAPRGAGRGDSEDPGPGRGAEVQLHDREGHAARATSRGSTGRSSWALARTRD